MTKLVFILKYLFLPIDGLGRVNIRPVFSNKLQSLPTELTVFWNLSRHNQNSLTPNSPKESKIKFFLEAANFTHLIPFLPKMHTLWNGDDSYQPRFSNGSMCLFLPVVSCIDAAQPRRSLSYDKLPPEPLSLTVLKLDGSSFGTLLFLSCLICMTYVNVHSYFIPIYFISNFFIFQDYIFLVLCL